MYVIVASFPFDQYYCCHQNLETFFTTVHGERIRSRRWVRKKEQEDDPGHYKDSLIGALQNSSIFFVTSKENKLLKAEKVGGLEQSLIILPSTIRLVLR